MWWPNAFASWEAVQYLSTWGVLGFQAAEEILVRAVENRGRRTVMFLALSMAWRCWWYISSLACATSFMVRAL